MATERQVTATYDYLDELWRLSLGEHADISCAYFGADTSKTLAAAQRDKHALILQWLGFRPGDSVLDIGCGHGGFLHAVRERGGVGKGLNLSPAQTETCRRAKLDVELRDWRELDAPPESFDHIVVVEALEHFCTPDDAAAGRQFGIYRTFFEWCARVLRPGGGLFLQCFTWGASAPAAHEITLDAPRGSDRTLLASYLRFFGGSCPPRDVAQLAEAAGEWVSVETAANSRADYLETMARWRKEVAAIRLRKLPAFARVLPYFFTDRDFMQRVKLLLGGHARICLERKLLDHERLTFRKK